MTKNIQSLLTALSLAACFLSSCDVKTEIYDTDHPGQGRVTLTTDWGDRGTTVGKPAAYTVELDSYLEEATTDVHTPDRAFDPGNYTLYAYNNVNELSVSNGTATVTTVTAPDGTSDTFVAPLSGFLLAGALPITVEADKKHAFTVATHQQVRQLTLLIEPAADIRSEIAAITATLSGVAGAWDFVGNKPVGAPANMAFYFTQVDEGEHAGKWMATIRLLGVTGSDQRLTLDVMLAFTSDQVLLYSDLSTDLANFNADKNEPMTLTNTIDLASVETSGTITDWVKDEVEIEGI